MRAAVVRGFNEPLVIEDRPVPHPADGQVLVKVEASGLCHTDIHAAHGDWPVKPAPPFVPGHEGVGIVAAVGTGVTGVSEGDRVAVPWLGWACGACECVRLRVGDALPEPAQHRLLRRRRLRRLRARRRQRSSAASPPASTHWTPRR